MQVPSGTRLGRYEIRAFLGAGGMGEVYLAHDTTLHRSVAIKLLRPAAADHTDSLGSIEREAFAASSLNHPNILTVYEIGTQDSRRFIATEFIEGESLRRRIQRGRLELRQVLDIGAQAASALAAAHAAGIVHRDVKPENIMIRKDGIVKVLDFGLAKVVESRESAWDPEARTVAATDTAPGLVRGTVNYMSPEQARGLGTDPRTDVWSLGVVLYELCTGRSTFEGRTTSDVIASILTSAPPPLARYADDAPPELERIIMKALQKDREERYQAIQDLGLDLKALKRRLDFDAERARHDSTPAESAASSKRRHSRLLFVLPLAAVAIAALANVGYLANFRKTTARDIDSIAVLPFVNETGNPETDYLCDGISISLINSLSALSGVKVIARTSAFIYKGKEVDPRDIARALGVKAIVTGRITQRGGDLSIGVELVDVVDRTLVWGEQYHRKTADLLQLQGEISGEIADKLHRRLSAADRDRLMKHETTNPQAYDLVLRGHFYFDKGGTQNRKIAIEHYERALAIDPAYPLAYVSLAQAYHYLIFLSVANPQEYTPKVEAAVRKALELDDTLAEAHNALGQWKRSAWDWPGAERAYKRAISLNTNLAVAHDGYADYLGVVGRHDEAVAERKRAIELDPLSLGFATRLGLTLLFARRHDEAIGVLNQSLAIDPTSSVTYLFLGYNHAAKGMFADAIDAYQEAIRLGDDSASAQIYLGAAYARSGDRGKAHAILKRLQTSSSYVSPGELAILYAAVDQHEQAFASLERAFKLRDLQLIFLAVDPAFDSLRDDSRFEDLIRRVGLPPSTPPAAAPGR